MIRKTHQAVGGPCPGAAVTRSQLRLPNAPLDCTGEAVPTSPRALGRTTGTSGACVHILLSPPTFQTSFQKFPRFTSTLACSRPLRVRNTDPPCLLPSPHPRPDGPLASLCGGLEIPALSSVSVAAGHKAAVQPTRSTAGATSAPGVPAVNKCVICIPLVRGLNAFLCSPWFSWRKAECFLFPPDTAGPVHLTVSTSSPLWSPQTAPHVQPRGRSPSGHSGLCPMGWLTPSCHPQADVSSPEGTVFTISARERPSGISGAHCTF